MGTKKTFPDWEELTLLAEKLTTSGEGPTTATENEWQGLRDALDTLVKQQDLSDVIQLRRLFKELYARDTIGGFPLLQRLDDEAIKSARTLNDLDSLAHLLGARGHNLHRQGLHQKSIDAFEESSKIYKNIGNSFEALKNHYMTSLCYRALGNRQQAQEVLHDVLHQLEPDNLWRGNPLQVMAWLVQDEGKLDDAEQYLREAIHLFNQDEGTDILLAGALADLGEIAGLQQRFEEAETLFHQSLAILNKHSGQYARQEARTLLKLAELMIRNNDLNEATQLLNQSDDKISRSYGHYYDLLWRIELARSYLYFKQKDFSSAFRKFRQSLKYRRSLGLSNKSLVKQLAIRYLLGTGLPR